MTLGVLFNTDRLDRQGLLAYARQADELGIESVWLPELFTRDPFALAAYLLAGTSRVRLATGIANVYARDATATAAAAMTLQEMSEGRFILGLGVSNAGLNAARGHEWEPPVAKMTAYLAAMRAVRLSVPPTPFPVHVAAHGPRMLEVAATCADGANTYLMPPDHVAMARATLGDRALNTMLFCLHDEDPVSARATARKAIAFYVGLDYYRRAWRSFGFTADDFDGGGSDALVDAVVAWGDFGSVAGRVRRQLDDGATRVVVIPIARGQGGQPDWALLQRLAAAVG